MNIPTHLTGLALGDHLKKLPADPTRSFSTPVSLLTIALLFAFLLTAPAAHAEEVAPGDPGEIIIVVPPVETPAPEPAPPEPETPPTDTGVPPPATELPPAAPEQRAPAAPAAPSFNQRPVAPQLAPGKRAGIPLLPANTQETPAPETAAPTPDVFTPSATPSPATEASTAAPAIVPTGTPGPHAASTELHAVSAMAEGSPLAVQLLTVLALLGAGLVYFRTLGSKRFRRPAGARK